MPEGDNRLASDIADFMDFEGKKDPAFYAGDGRCYIYRNTLMEWERRAADLDYSHRAKIPLCENCDFFRPNDTTIQDADGQCRRNPPNGKGVFPPVWKKEWCGEHRWKFTKRSDGPQADHASQPSSDASLQTKKENQS
jgi:hypothetical protein